VCGSTLVSISLDTGAEVNFTVPASALTRPESLIKGVPSARHKASASSVSRRLHCGQRFILRTQPNALKEAREARVRVKAVEEWVNFNVREIRSAILIATFKLLEGFVLITFAFG